MQHSEVSFFARLRVMARPPVPKTPFEAAVAALDRGRFDEALEQLSAALAAARSAGEQALVHNKRAVAQLGRGDRAAAVAALVEALDADGRCVPAIVNLGNLALEEGVLDEAVAHYEAAVRIDDGYGPAYLNLGIAYKRLGRRAEAVRAFRRASRLMAGRRRG